MTRMKNSCLHRGRKGDLQQDEACCKKTWGCMHGPKATQVVVSLHGRSGSEEVVQALLSAAPRGRHPSIRDRNKRGMAQAPAM